MQPESKVSGNLPLINPEPEGRGVISGKLPMTKDKESIFVEYTIVAMVHMIYTNTPHSILYNKTCNYV